MGEENEVWADVASGSGWVATNNIQEKAWLDVMVLTGKPIILQTALPVRSVHVKPALPPKKARIQAHQDKKENGR